MGKVRVIETLTHILAIIIGWSLLNYPAFDLTFGLFRSGDYSLLLPSLIGTIFNLIIFYGTVYYLVPEILKQKGKSHFWVMLLLLLAIMSSIEIWLDAIFARQRYGSLRPNQWSEIVIMTVGVHLLVLLIAFAYRFTKDWFANERWRRSVSERQLQTELDLLKSQINPHFLFNALNNLFSMALQQDDLKTAEGISKLAEMMRYVFEKSGREQVGLDSEIQYIKDYIYLQQLRYEDQVSVDFKYPELVSLPTLAPMLLIPFVENAFKYGVSPQESTQIQILLTYKMPNLEFQICNPIMEVKRDTPSSGIGIENVKKRLSLLYPDKHEIKLEENDRNFIVDLKIVLV